MNSSTGPQSITPISQTYTPIRIPYFPGSPLLRTLRTQQTLPRGLRSLPLPWHPGLTCQRLPGASMLNAIRIPFGVSMQDILSAKAEALAGDAYLGINNLPETAFLPRTLPGPARMHTRSRACANRPLGHAAVPARHICLSRICQPCICQHTCLHRTYQHTCQRRTYQRRICKHRICQRHICQRQAYRICAKISPTKQQTSPKIALCCCTHVLPQQACFGRSGY